MVPIHSRIAPYLFQLLSGEGAQFATAIRANEPADDRYNQYMTPLPATGLYAITPPPGRELPPWLDRVVRVLEGGARVLQYRDKVSHHSVRTEIAARLQELCAQHDVPLVINDDIALACRVGASGVHLGVHDSGVDSAREMLGPKAIVGTSCYNSLPLAEAEAKSGATYLAFGSVFPSTTKPDATPCPLDIFKNARSLGLPMVAIGGITPENGKAVLDAGATHLAVISGLFDAPDPRAAAQAFADLF